MIRSSLLVAVLFLTANSIAFAAGDREARVAKDRQYFSTKSDWIYNDLEKAYADANQSGKPIMVVLRCVPCTECVKLDDDVITNDPVLAPLMERFVLARVTSTNGLDLDTFQFDTDQSFAVFFLNADKTVYGRYGTRSHRTEWEGDVSVAGLTDALVGALELHQRYPQNKSKLAAKSGRSIEFASPEKYPALRDKPASLDFESASFAASAVKNCIHCHQVGEARINYYWDRKEPVPDVLMYPYPHPKSIGLILDPSRRAHVESVTNATPAAKAGLKAGDDILEMNGQPLISMADMQWVLHHLPNRATSVDVLVERDGRQQQMQIELPEQWRKLDDTAWRVSRWTMRMSFLGGMKLTPNHGNAEHESIARKAARGTLPVYGAGKFGKHGTARRAGVNEGDVIVSFDGRRDFASEAEVLDYVNATKHQGDKIRMELLRNGKTIKVTYPVQ